MQCGDCSLRAPQTPVTWPLHTRTVWRMCRVRRRTHQVVVGHVQARVDAVQHQAQWRGDGLLVCRRRLKDARLRVTHEPMTLRACMLCACSAMAL